MTKKRTIVAIGGGRMYLSETLFIDKQIIKLTGKKTPKGLFLPTASGDNDEYCESFKRIYGDVLNCEIDFLKLVKKNQYLSQEKIRAKILKSDFIYVSGGNTLYMLKIWRKYKINNHLKDAWKNGVVLAGMSAGSICWFLGGLSDSGKDKYNEIKGMGIINHYNCPHYNEKARKEYLTAKILQDKKRKIWYALEDNTAMIINLDKFKIIKTSDNFHAYRIYKKLFNDIIYQDLKSGRYYKF